MVVLQHGCSRLELGFTALFCKYFPANRPVGVPNSSVLATLQSRCLPLADTLPQRDADVAARMLTQSKQLALILDATLTNAAWQYYLGISNDRLGDLAVVQGDLAGALRCFSRRNVIAERLAASDPTNAAWQRALAVSHSSPSRSPQKAEDEAMMQAELRACFLVLDGMKRRGLHMDPPIANLHGQLAGMFGAE